MFHKVKKNIKKHVFKSRGREINSSLDVNVVLYIFANSLLDENIKKQNVIEIK